MDWKNEDVHKAESFLSNGIEDSAFYYLVKAEKSYLKVRNDSARALLNHRMALWHRKQGQIEKALARIDHAISYFENNDTLRWAHFLLTKASIHLVNKDYSKATKYVDLSEELNLALNDSLLQTLTYIHHYYSLRSQERNRLSFEYLKKAHDLTIRHSGSSRHFSWITNLLATYYLENNKAIKALELNRDALRVVDIENAKLRYGIYKSLGNTFQKLSNLDSAYFYQQKYISAYKDWEGHQRKELAMKLETEYQNEIKNAEIERLKLQSESQGRKQLVLIISTFSLLAIIILGIYSFIQYRRSQQHEKELLLKESDRLKKESQVRNLKSMIIGQENERKRFARELHDALGGSALMVKLAATNFPKDEAHMESYDKLIKSADDNIQLIRDISKDLMPAALEKFGLEIAIQEYIDRLKNLSTIEIYYNFIGLSEEQRMDHQLELNLYRCIQEILTNVIKHAEASEIQLTFLKTHNEVKITIEDDGKGFVLTEEAKSQGLHNLEMRCEFMGAEWHMDSVKDQGTTWVIGLALE